MLSNLFSVLHKLMLMSKIFPGYMSAQTKSKSHKQVMPGNDANLFQEKTEMLMKLSTLELTQATVVKDVNKLKKRFNSFLTIAANIGHQ